MTLADWLMAAFFITMAALFWHVLWIGVSAIDKDVEERVDQDLINSKNIPRHERRELSQAIPVDDPWCDDCRSYSHRRDCPSYKVPQE